MSVVLDASVLIAALIDSGRGGQWAEGVLASDTVHAPELICVEVANILRRLERARQITAPEANAAYADLAQLRLDLYPFGPFAERIWELRFNLTSYDAWYVAVAESLELPLATLDVHLARAKGPTCEFLMPDVT